MTDIYLNETSNDLEIVDGKLVSEAYQKAVDGLMTNLRKAVG
ncbi:MAG: hypothetical protein ACPGRD_11780 [Planktomarina sp.]